MTIADVRSNDALIAAMRARKKAKYVFFWGHRQNGAEVTKACFSQWFPARFADEEGTEYRTAEHYMMAEKARLFQDKAALTEILASKTPGG